VKSGSGGEALLHQKKDGNKKKIHKHPLLGHIELNTFNLDNKILHTSILDTILKIWRHRNRTITYLGHLPRLTHTHTKNLILFLLQGVFIAFTIDSALRSFCDPDRFTLTIGTVLVLTKSMIRSLLLYAITRYLKSPL
jgi:hypothetical protein